MSVIQAWYEAAKAAAPTCNPNPDMQPGIYEMPHDVYHADPCPEPSLSAGMINDILQAPAKCRENSRRLNPDYEEDDKIAPFTIGTVAHILFLEPQLFEAAVVVVQADDWRGKDAKAARDVAKALGKTPILQKHLDKIREARAAFYANEFTARAFEGGKFEQSMFWRHPVYGFWCRARPDFIAASGAHMCDYKTASTADPAQFGRRAYDLGYHRRAAWYLDGYEALTGNANTRYWFVNQEIKAPWLTSVVELDLQAIEAGRAENNRAAALFARCLDTGDWFGYRHATELTRDLAFQVGLPNYAYMQIDQRNAA